MEACGGNSSSMWLKVPLVKRREALLSQKMAAAAGLQTGARLHQWKPLDLQVKGQTQVRPTTTTTTSVGSEVRV